MTKDEMLKEMFDAAAALAKKLKEDEIPERVMHTIAFDSSGYVHCTLKDGHVLESFDRLSDKHKAERRTYYDERSNC